jgi:hypothetical protein
MASIFISYRREDTAGHAGRLCDRLSARFGDDRVFMDVQDIQPGQHFPQSIDRSIAGSDCVIAVIGPRWLELLHARGTGEDFVRHEVRSALERGVTVVPVLIGGARMPPARDLPADLARLSHLNALELRDERFDDDVQRLEEQLRGVLSGAGGAPGWIRTWGLRLAIPMLLLIALPVFFVGNRSTPPSLDGVWIAEMQKPGQRPYRIRLQFAATGGQLTGLAQYPTGEGPILDAALDGTSIRFHTSHVPQFESEPATIRFQGEVVGGEIRLAATDVYGVATGVARRADAP